MKIEIKAPAFPESVADGEVSLWHKQEGDFVQRDELLALPRTKLSSPGRARRV